MPTRRRSGSSRGICQFAASEKSLRSTPIRRLPKMISLCGIDDRAQNRRGLFRHAAGDGVANCFRRNPVLEREAEQHAGVARDRLDVVPGLQPSMKTSPGVPSA